MKSSTLGLIGIVLTGVSVLGGIILVSSSIPQTKKVDTYSGVEIFNDGSESWSYFVFLENEQFFFMTLEEAKLAVDDFMGVQG